MVSGKSDRGCGPTGRWCRDAKPDKLTEETMGKMRRKLESCSVRGTERGKHQICFAFAALGPAVLAQRTQSHTDTHGATHSPRRLHMAYGLDWFCCWFL